MILDAGIFEIRNKSMLRIHVFDLEIPAPKGARWPDFICVSLH